MINLFPLHFQWATYTTQTLSTPKLVSQCLHYIPANVFCNVHSWKCRLPARKELCLCDLFSRYIHDHSWGAGEKAGSLEYFVLCNIQKVKAGGEERKRGIPEEEKHPGRCFLQSKGTGLKQVSLRVVYANEAFSWQKKKKKKTTLTQNLPAHFSLRAR